MTATEPKSSEPCSVCGAHWSSTNIISIPGGGTTQPDGSILLVCVYTDAYLCDSCLGSAESLLERRRRAAFQAQDWIHWDEKDNDQKVNTFAYHKAKNFTWQLLPSGRPKKLTKVLLPPWMR